MIDARIAVTLPGHPKTKKLIRRLGDGAAWKLICLFLWAASNRPNGDLSGLADDDIEIAVDWSGEEGAFIGALRSVGFLDGESCAYQIHDWNEHNAWASGADLRSAKARWNAVKRHHGEAEADRQVPEWAEKRAAFSASSNASSSTASNARSNAKDFSSNAPSPSPSPSPVVTTYQKNLPVVVVPEPSDADAARSELKAALSDLRQRFPSFAIDADQAILDNPRFYSTGGGICRIETCTNPGLLRATAAKVRAYGKQPKPKDASRGAPAWDLGTTRYTEAEILAWDERLGPKPQPANPA